MMAMQIFLPGMLSLHQTGIIPGTYRTMAIYVRLRASGQPPEYGLATSLDEVH
jgi:hypothetical protein